MIQFMVALNRWMQEKNLPSWARPRIELTFCSSMARERFTSAIGYGSGINAISHDCLGQIANIVLEFNIRDRRVKKDRRGRPEYVGGRREQMLKTGYGERRYFEGVVR